MIECHHSNQVTVTIRCQSRSPDIRPTMVTLTTTTTTTTPKTAVSVPNDLHKLISQLYEMVGRNTKILEYQVCCFVHIKYIYCLIIFDRANRLETFLLYCQNVVSMVSRLNTSNKCSCQ